MKNIEEINRENVKKISAEKKLPDKPVEIIAVSHNVLIDFAAIALLGLSLIHI